MEEQLKKIGPFEIIAQVGAGGLGKVYKARDPSSGRVVAIKVLHDRFLKNKKFLGIFHRELLIASQFRHKYIIDYIDSHFDPPNCYIVSEFINGWSGYQLLQQVGRVPPLVALSLMLNCLQGIDYLHLHDTVHSDFSSANYLVNHAGRVYVTDFGLACQLKIEDYRNQSIGTPGYLSPEHISRNPLGVQTDIYCAGLILYELLTGKKAVPSSKNMGEVVFAMKNIKFGLVVCENRRMQTMIRKILKKALEVKARKRFSSAEDMIYACVAVMDQFQLRYATLAIHQFLVDKKLSAIEHKAVKQDIYVGAI